MKIRCPHCRNPIEIVDDPSFEEIPCPTCGSSFSLVGKDDRTLSLGADDPFATESHRSVKRTIGSFQLVYPTCHEAPARPFHLACCYGDGDGFSSRFFSALVSIL